MLVDPCSTRGGDIQNYCRTHSVGLGSHFQKGGLGYFFCPRGKSPALPDSMVVEALGRIPKSGFFRRNIASHRKNLRLAHLRFGNFSPRPLALPNFPVPCLKFHTDLKKGKRMKVIEFLLQMLPWTRKLLNHEQIAQVWIVKSHQTISRRFPRLAAR